MLSTYDRLMAEARVTRRTTIVYDNRSQHDLVNQLTAEVEALRRKVKELEQQST